MVYDSEQAAGVYTCIVYRDRAVRAKRLVEQFTTELDPRDPRSLQATLAAAIRRDRGDGADPYSMDVLGQDGYLVVENYRPTQWLD
jgi:hypothetical protein